ncbi:MAG: adenosylhomocysteinase [Chloroflexota bacterium]
MSARQHTSTIADLGLAGEGERRIQWVAQHSPVLNRLKEADLRDGTLVGRRIALAIHLEAKTAYLALVLAEAGATVTVGGSNPHTTRDDVCAALVRRGLTVHAVQDSPRDQWEHHLEMVLDSEPDLIVDDGAELVSRLVSRKPHLIEKVRGSSEETTTGVLKLRAMHREGVLPWPAMAANDAACKHLFDNRYGTGQTAIEAILRTTNTWMGGKTVVTVGYGWVGKGVAQYAAGMNARVVVSEVDDVKALEAFADGHGVMAMEDAAEIGDIFITCTGGIDSIRGAHVQRMKDGAIIANAGHYDLEINLNDLRAMSAEVTDARHQITEYRLPDGRRIHVLAGGELVNIAAGDGHPIEIMDLTFAVQALSTHYLAAHASELNRGVHALPEEIDQRIARIKLESLGATVDHLTEPQRQYLSSWR